MKRKSQNTDQTSASSTTNWKPGQDIMWGDMMIAPDHPKYNEYASRLRAGEKPPGGMPLPPKRTQPKLDSSIKPDMINMEWGSPLEKPGQKKQYYQSIANLLNSQGQVLGSAGGLFDSRPSTTPVNPSQSFLMAEQDKPTEQPKHLDPNHVNRLLPGGKSWTTPPAPANRNVSSSARPTPQAPLRAPQQFSASQTEANTQSRVASQPQTASGLPIKGYTGGAWADLGAQQSFQAHSFNKPTSSTDAERIAASSQIMAQNNPGKWAVGPDGMLVDRKSFKTQSVTLPSGSALQSLRDQEMARRLNPSGLHTGEMTPEQRQELGKRIAASGYEFGSALSNYNSLGRQAKGAPADGIDLDTLASRASRGDREARNILERRAAAGDPQAKSAADTLRSKALAEPWERLARAQQENARTEAAMKSWGSGSQGGQPASSKTSQKTLPRPSSNPKLKKLHMAAQTGNPAAIQSYEKALSGSNSGTAQPRLKPSGGGSAKPQFRQIDGKTRVFGNSKPTGSQGGASAPSGMTSLSRGSGGGGSSLTIKGPRQSQGGGSISLSGGGRNNKGKGMR